MTRPLALSSLALGLAACATGLVPSDAAAPRDAADVPLAMDTATVDDVPAPVDDTVPPADVPASDTAARDAGTVLPTRALTLGFWCGVPAAFMSADRFTEIAQAGFTVASAPCEGGANNPAYNNQLLDFAHRAGLRAIVSDDRLAAAVAGTNVAANLDAVVHDYAMAPALAAYFLGDEPSAGAFPALATVVDGLHRRDPAHFGYVNLLPNYASPGQLGTASYDDYLTRFVDTVMPAAYSYDHYNFYADGTDGAPFFPNLASARAVSVASHVPFWQYIQSISYTGHRATNGPEKRWAAMHTLAYGGAGVMYFTYWTPTQTSESFGTGLIDGAGHRTSQYADVQAINQSLAAIGQYTTAAVSTGVFHNGPLAPGAVPHPPGASVYIPSAAAITVGMFEIPGTRDAYALLVNRDHTAMSATDVWLASADGAPESLDIATARFAPMSVLAHDATMGTRVHVALAPGDGTLLHLRGPVPPGAPGAEVYYGTVRADAGWLDVVDSRFGTQRVSTAGWNTCPAGYTVAGRDFQSNGFWLCARNDLATRTFLVGNVVSDAGNYYRVQGGMATRAGSQGWDTCTSGTLLGHRFESNGFWVCME